MRDAPPGGIMCISNALVAQPDRASDYESEGRRFESCRARPSNSRICRNFSLNLKSCHEARWLFDSSLTVARASLALESNYYSWLQWRCTQIRCCTIITKSAPKLRAVVGYARLQAFCCSTAQCDDIDPYARHRHMPRCDYAFIDGSRSS